MELSATTIIAIVAVILVLRLCKKAIHKIIGLVIILGIAGYIISQLGII